MTTSSSKWRRNVPPPPMSEAAAAAKGTVYSRFIPREELGGFSAWNPDVLSGGFSQPAERRAAPRAEPDADAGAALAAVRAAAAVQASAARQVGYQDGYRDGLAALDAFKQSYAAQITAQLGALVEGFDRQLDALHQPMADALAAVAVRLARRVVRSELALRPALVATVADDAIATLLTSARHVTVRVHPDDQPLVAQGSGEALAARGARLVADPALARGGCLVDADIGAVDATLEARWAQAAAMLGSAAAWDDGGAAVDAPGGGAT